MSLVDHAKTELALLRGPDFDPAEDGGMQDEMDRCVLDVVRVFAGQGHSGSSAAYALGCIEKLLRFEPISPLTGAEDEWIEVGTGIEQNRRCGRVFRESGKAYDIEGYVFRDPDGSTWTNGDSRRPVEFPYTPETEIVDRDPSTDGAA